MTVLEYTVRIEPRGRTLRVRAGQSVLAAALAAGLNLPHSCKSGHCSSCRARLACGQVRYPAGRPLGITEMEAAQGYVLLCQAQPLSDLVLEARAIASVAEVEVKSLPCRIARLDRPAPDVARLLLRLPAVEPLSFEPGQYLDVLLEDGRRRSFSIASPPHEADLLELHVRRAAGGAFSSRLFAPAANPLQVGSLLRIEGPFGQFVYVEDPAEALLIAGGTGFAPLKSMLRHALAHGSGRSLHLYWGVRSRADLYDEELLFEWTGRFPNFRFTAVLADLTDRGAGQHRCGLVHEAVLADRRSLAGVEVYAAGPPAMIAALRASFPACGLAAARLHFDSFDPAP